MNTIKAIETRYRGYHFRSRLEARWAVFFDALGVRWEYEKEGYELPIGPYLPDFWLPCGPFEELMMAGAGFWVEIKPAAPTQIEMQLMAELVKGTGHRGYIFYGMPDVGCGAIVFQHWRGGKPEKIPLVSGKIGASQYAKCSFSMDVICANDHDFRFPCPFNERGMTNEEAFCNRYRSAIHAARSARFEHGRQG